MKRLRQKTYKQPKSIMGLTSHDLYSMEQEKKENDKLSHEEIMEKYYN